VNKIQLKMTLENSTSHKHKSTTNSEFGSQEWQKTPEDESNPPCTTSIKTQISNSSYA